MINKTNDSDIFNIMEGLFFDLEKKLEGLPEEKRKHRRTIAIAVLGQLIGHYISNSVNNREGGAALRELVVQGIDRYLDLMNLDGTKH